MTDKEIQTIVAVQGEKINNIKQDIEEIKNDVKCLSTDMKEHMTSTQENTNKLLYWFIGGMGTIIVLLITPYIK
jgi:hypothetical protein